MIKNIFLTLIAFGFLFAEADHIIFSRITTTPNDAEMVAIYNPTPDAINLSNYYLSDAGAYYYNLPSNDNYWSEANSSFIARFPDIDIEPNQTLSIGFHDAVSFINYYSTNPDFSLQEDMLSVSNDNTIGSDSNMLNDNFESLILFYWDGFGSTIQDVDYFVWGIAQAGVDKSGVDGYCDDTSFDIQNERIMGGIEEGESYIRKSNTENGECGSPDSGDMDECPVCIEPADYGNGITDHDETSEIFIDSWDIISENGCFVADCGCLLPEDPNYDESAEVSCLDIDDNGYGDCCVANAITHTIEDIVTGSSTGYAATIAGLVVGFGDFREPNNGPQVIEIRDNGYQVDLVVWDFDVLDSDIGYMVNPNNPTQYVILATGIADLWNGSWQFEVAATDDISEYQSLNPEGVFVQDDDLIKASIDPAPYVIIPTRGERLDYSFSFPVISQQGSRVIIRILDFNGNYITSLVDQIFNTSGTILRFVDGSDWDGKDHLGQIVGPGTYLMHIEVTDLEIAKTWIDIAPIVVGVYK